MDYGMATVSNKMSNSQNGVLKRVGNFSNLVRSVPTRVQNVKDANKKKYQNAIDESVAHGSAMVGAFGGDKDAVAINKGKKIEAKKKDMKEAPMNTATDIEAEAKAQNLIAQKDGIKEKDIQDLIASLDKLDEDTRKAALKKAEQVGYGHLSAKYKADKETDEWIKTQNATRAAAGDPVLDSATIESRRSLNRQRITTDMYQNMSGNTLAKQKIYANYANSTAAPGSEEHRNLELAFTAMESRVAGLRGRDAVDFRSGDGASNRAAERAAAQAKTW
jgi:hypothetical protein